jgi:hypothetical protein
MEETATQPKIVDISKSRQRAIYWRQDSRGRWVQTSPLPADAVSINYYFAKGFRAKNPDEEKSQQYETSIGGDIRHKGSAIMAEEGSNGDTIKCPQCGFGAQSAFGLQAHLRKHKNKSEKEEKA